MNITLLNDHQLRLLTAEQIHALLKEHWPEVELTYGKPATNEMFAMYYGGGSKSAFPFFVKKKLFSSVISAVFDLYRMTSFYEPKGGLRVVVSRVSADGSACLVPGEIACIGQARSEDDVFDPIEDDYKYVVFRIPIENHDVSTHNCVVCRKVYQVLTSLLEYGYIGQL